MADAQTNTSGDKKTVLLVEDDQFLSSLLQNRFTKEGFDVTLVRSGGEALKVLKTLRPDLILLDLILPEKSGFEVLEQIRSDIEIEKTPVVIVSNLGQQEDISKVKNLGVLEYFVKAKTPIDDLVSQIKNMIKN